MIEKFGLREGGGSCSGIILKRRREEGVEEVQLELTPLPSTTYNST